MGAGEGVGHGKHPGSSIGFFLFSWGEREGRTDGQEGVQHKSKDFQCRKEESQEGAMRATLPVCLHPARVSRALDGVAMSLSCLSSPFAWLWQATSTVWTMLFPFCSGFALLSYFPCIINCLWHSSFEHFLLHAAFENGNEIGQSPSQLPSCLCLLLFSRSQAE